MTITFNINLRPYPRGFHLVTQEIVSQLSHLPKHGLLVLFIKHTSAALTINENADPDVRYDFNQFFDRSIPDNTTYFTHTDEGPDDMSAHLKASLLGFSVSIPICNHRLNLGTWQGIYLGEFRNNGGSRRISVTIIE